MRRRSFLNVVATASVGAPLVVPAMLAAKPASTFTDDVVWSRGEVSASAKLGHLTVIAGPPKSGKTDLLRKFCYYARGYGMKTIASDSGTCDQMMDDIEAMFGPGRDRSKVAHVMTCDMSNPVTNMLVQLMRHTKKLYYEGQVIPVSVVDLPARTEPWPDHAV